MDGGELPRQLQAALGGGILGLLALVVRTRISGKPRTFEAEWWKWALGGAIVGGIASLTPPPSYEAERSRVAEGCARGCQRTGAQQKDCQAFCACVMHHVEEGISMERRATFWADLNADHARYLAVQFRETCAAEIRGAK